MAIKRYTPKYKILSKLKQPIWFEKRSKIKKFTRQKWEGKERVYFPRKIRYFDQDSSTFVVSRIFDGDRSFNLTKVYKYLLQDKKAFLSYYGGKRMKFYQLKTIGTLVKHLSQKKRLSAGKVFLHFFENRLEVCLVRLGFVTSLTQARKLLTSSRVVVNNYAIKNFGLHMKTGDFIRIEHFKLIELLGRYLKFNLPFFYFRKKEQRSSFLLDRKRVVSFDFLKREALPMISFLKKSLSTVYSLKNRI